MKSIAPQELKARLDRGDALVLVDVREPSELALAKFPGAKLIPMKDLPFRLQELDPDAETVVICHHGIRSAHVIAHLEPQGFAKLWNLRGGLDAWSCQVDPTVPRY